MVKKRLTIELDMEDPTPERIRVVVDRVMETLKKTIRRSDTPMVGFEDVDG